MKTVCAHWKKILWLSEKAQLFNIIMMSNFKLARYTLPLIFYNWNLKILEHWRTHKKQNRLWAYIYCSHLKNDVENNFGICTWRGKMLWGRGWETKRKMFHKAFEEKPTLLSNYQKLPKIALATSINHIATIWYYEPAKSLWFCQEHDSWVMVHWP